MASVLSNLSDKITYQIHNLTYDPEAERYAQEKQKADEYQAVADQKATNKAERDKAATDKDASLKAQKEKDEADRKAKASFNTKRMVGKAMGIITTILLIFALVAGGIFGASLATNLNLYRTWPYRLLYAIYGFVFFPVVILYVFAYRWFFQGKKPRYYSLLPLIPYHLDHPWTAQFLAWMSYKPDDAIHALQEWSAESIIAGTAYNQSDV